MHRCQVDRARPSTLLSTLPKAGIDDRARPSTILSTLPEARRRSARTFRMRLVTLIITLS